MSTATADKPFAVLCWKSNGTTAEFNRYATREESQAIVDRLGAVGCSAFVEQRNAAAAVPDPMDGG